MKRVYLMGVPFNPCTMEEALTCAGDALRGKESCLTVVTPNAVIAGKCLATPALAELLDRAGLCLPDGAGTLLAARLAGGGEGHPERNRKRSLFPHRKKKSSPLPDRGTDADTPSEHVENDSDTSRRDKDSSGFPERVAGIDFAYGVLRIAAEEGIPVYLLGGKPGVAGKAGEHLCTSLPRLCIAGVHDGYFDDAKVPEILEDIRTSGAGILFVCLGFPRQERFLLEHSGKLAELRLAAGLGGSLDVWAGTVRRAPERIQKARLEWLWRVAKEPHRASELRYAVRFLGAAMLRRGNLHRRVHEDTEGIRLERPESRTAPE